MTEEREPRSTAPRGAARWLAGTGSSTKDRDDVLDVLCVAGILVLATTVSLVGRGVERL